MFYKVIQDNIITEVGYKCLRWQNKNKLLLGCDASIAQYIMTDIGNIYETEWLQYKVDNMPRYPMVNAIQITEEEYKALSALLTIQENIPLPENLDAESEVEEDEEQPTPEIMNMSTASGLLIELTKKYNELLAHSALLEECVLELSQELYK